MALARPHLKSSVPLEDERDAAVDSASACQEYLVATADVLDDYKDLSTFFVTLLSGGDGVHRRELREASVRL